MLLQGWVLLNDYCKEPGCNLPLVKNQEGLLCCVACPKLNQGSPRRVEPEPNKNTPEYAPALSLSSQNNPANKNAASTTSQLALSKLDPFGQELARVQPIEPPINNSPAPPSSNLQLQQLDTNDSSTPWDQIANPTEALLLQKIGAARRQLAECNSVADSAALCSLIAEAANALKAIKSLES